MAKQKNNEIIDSWSKSFRISITFIFKYYIC